MISNGKETRNEMETAYIGLYEDYTRCSLNSFKGVMQGII